MPKVIKPLGEMDLRRIQEGSGKPLRDTPGLHMVGGAGAQGLGLQVRAAQVDGGHVSRSWVLRFMLDGTRRDMGLGSFPQVSLAQARERAREARALMAKGIDPVRERQRQRSLALAEQAGSMTFRAAAGELIKTKEAGWTNPKHAAQWRTTLEQYAYPVLGSLQVEDIRLAHVAKVLNPLWHAKTETAQRLRGRIEAVLDWAGAHGYRSGENPARWRGNLDKVLAAPRKVAPTKHYAAVPLSDAAQVMAAIRYKAGTGARALEFLVLTAARSGEVRGAQWGEIDLDAGLWVVPKERMKAGREHRVPLSCAAVELLKELRRDEGQGLVFPSFKGGPISDMTLTKAMRDIGRAETVHGWRSTFRDWAAELTNYPGDMAEMALAHTVGDKVEAAYRRLDMVEKRRRMMEDWAAYLLASRAASGSVVPLRERRKAST